MGRKTRMFSSSSGIASTRAAAGKSGSSDILREAVVKETEVDIINKTAD